MYHISLRPETWFSYPLVTQLAHVGSEVERSILWREKKPEYMKLAFFRALELLDLTIDDPKNALGLKELCRVREFLVDYFLYDNVYGFDDASWRKYFMTFALAARK